MNAFPAQAYEPPPEPRPRAVTMPDHASGTYAMALFIATEAMLFVMLFFAYVFLSRGDLRWLRETPPQLPYALTMLGVLLLSSAVLLWGETRAKAGRLRVARNATLGTVALGIVFLVLQVLEYRKHLKELTPTSDAYGAIFYTITSVHGFHLVLGLLMLVYVAGQTRLAQHADQWHASLTNTAMYWHFVDGIWVLIVLLLYLIPNWRQ